MKGRIITYSSAEIDWLRANGTLPGPDLHAGFVAAFGRADVSKTNLVAKRKRMGLSTGRTGRFVPGQIPANKGKPMPFNAASAATRFKPGQLSGRARQMHKPIGAIRISKDGYRQIKIHDGLPMQSRWRGLHIVNWEKLNGPLPEGMALKCLGDDITNCDPANWQAIPRAVLARLNGGRFRKRIPYDEAAPELKPTLMAVAQLEHAVGKARRGAKGATP